jgi:nucleoside-diphosphate-sugar epimerase
MGKPMRNCEFEMLQGQTILITGATGLLGSNVVKYLVGQNRQLERPVKILALIRNREKVERLFGNAENIVYIVGDVREKLSVEQPVDYVVHTASQTASKAFIHEPVETIDTALVGTRNVLELAREKRAKKMLYLSTMEVYGAPTTDEKITEEHETNLNTMAVRSSYPESKRMCEALCCAYSKEYAVPVSVLRLTQTFGPGVTYNDGRVFAEFARCAIEKRDIVLHTKGETKRNYLYTVDAVKAILTVLLKGESGQAYNVANEATYCSIYEMAQMVAEKCAGGAIKVRVEVEDESKFGFAPTLKMNLDTSKLQRLGWRPEVGLEEMFHDLIADMQRKEHEDRNSSLYARTGL